MSVSEVEFIEDSFEPDDFVLQWRLPGEGWHRVGGPAIIARRDGAYGESYFQNGQQHSDDGPAVFEFLPNLGRLKLSWYRHGEHHRSDGPAVIEYDFNGTAIVVEWWVDGRRLKRVERPSDMAPSNAV